MPKLISRPFTDQEPILEQILRDYPREKHGLLQVYPYERIWKDHPDWREALEVDSKNGMKRLSQALANRLKGRVKRKPLVNVREVLAAAVDHPGTQPAQPAADVPWKFKELSNAEQRIMANNWARVMKGKDRMPRMVRGIFTCPFRSCDSYGKDFGSPNAVLMHCDRTHTKRVDPNRNGNPRKKVSEPMTTTNTTNGNVTSQQPQQSSNAVPCKLLECPACGTRFYMVKGSQ